MAGIYQSVTELIGRTPLLEVKNLEKELNLQARVLVKLEYFNPAGSVKDRAALQMITEAEENGTLKPGSAIIEPTSGNTGIGLASIAASRGQSNLCNAGNDEYRAKKTSEGIWRRNCAHRRSKGDERSHCKSKRAGAGD